MIKVGIIGGTGYTGIELLRLLSKHPHVQIVAITSRTESGMMVSEVYPSLLGLIDLKFSEPNTKKLLDCDLVFFATPNGVAMQTVPMLLDQGCRIIDLSADFRFQDPDIFEKWYEVKHECKELLNKAVYGLPEINREKIQTANLVANPGCYPTATILGLLPLLKNNFLSSSSLIADCKSGVSGAGKNPNTKLLMSEVNENFRAYNVTGHRHLPEIEQILKSISQENFDLTFVPHLVPMIRGIHATLYSESKKDLLKIHSLYEAEYKDEQFVQILSKDQYPETSNVRGSNICQISIHKSSNSDALVILSVIDNLVKGASGQAIQNMNLMFDFEESTGLEHIALVP